MDVWTYNKDKISCIVKGVHRVTVMIEGKRTNLRIDQWDEKNEEYLFDGWWLTYLSGQNNKTHKIMQKIMRFVWIEHTTFRSPYLRFLNEVETSVWRSPNWAKPAELIEFPLQIKSLCRSCLAAVGEKVKPFSHATFEFLSDPF